MNIKFKDLKIPTKLLIKPFNKSGRSFGTITSRHRKKLEFSKTYKILEFNYSNYAKNSSLAIIISTHLNIITNTIVSLIMYLNGIFKGFKKFVINTKNTSIGDILNYSIKYPCKLGSTRKLYLFPIGTLIHCVEGTPKKGMELARSNSTFIKVLFYCNKTICVLLPSGKYKLLDKNCSGVLGINNKGYLPNIQKAGSSYKLGFRPKVRGLAMNSIDHPHGGGEGKTSIGLKSIKTPWGKYSYGISSRKVNKIKSKFIIKHI